MSDPLRLTPDALESLLAARDDDAVAAFVAALYDRTGGDTEREGNVVTAATPDGDRERLLVWTDGRGRIGRLLGTDPPAPDVERVDAVVTLGRDADAAATIAEDAGAGVRDTGDLHDRLLYAMDRETCRALCREQFDRAVEPRPAPEDESGGVGIDALARPRVALVAVAVCALLVAGAAGLPGSAPSGGDAFVPGEAPGTADPGSGPVTPVGGGPGASTPDGAPEGTPADTPPPTVGTPPLPPPGEPELLEACPDDEPAGPVVRICLPPRPFSAEHRPDIRVGSTTTSLHGTFANPYDSEIRRASLRIETPPGWEARPVITSPFEILTPKHVLIGRLAPGESGNVSWLVSPPASADGGRYNVTVISEWEVPEYEGPDFLDNASTDANYFRVRKNYTYRVRPAECRNVKPCSLLAGDPNGSEPFEAGTVLENTTNTTAGYLYNPHNRTITNGTITLEPPNDAWSVRRNVTSPGAGTPIGSLEPGKSRPIWWLLTTPESADCSRDYTLQGTATYELEAGDRITVPFTVPVSVENAEGLCVVGPSPVSRMSSANPG